MNKKGFTLVEIIATIVIIAVVGLIAVPGVIKSFNNSRIDSIKIQENNLVQSGDLLLDDYCKDSINKYNKDKCDMYYQELVLTDIEKENNKDFLSNEKIYKYICVDDIKSLKYYTEELKFSGNYCNGVVIYEIDKKTNMKSDSYSYIKCNDSYKTEDKNIKIEELFKNCFDEIKTEDDYNKTFTVTVKHVENDLGGMEIKPRDTFLLSNQDYENETIISIKTTLHQKNGNTYNTGLNKGGKDIELTSRIEDGVTIYDITKLPKENLIINVVYSVEKHNIVTNYFKYTPGSEREHSTQTLKQKTTLTGFTYETVSVDAPEELTEKINGQDEKYILYAAYVDENKRTLPFDNNIDIGQKDKQVELVYQRESFNIKYNNNGGTGCDKGRIKYKENFNNLCEPTRTGYDFKGWSLTNGGEILKKEEQNLNYNDLNLYAVWEAHTFKFIFKGNGNASGKTEEIICEYDKDCKLPTNGFVRPGYKFDKWYLNQTQTGTGYSENTNLKNYKTENKKIINLYAGWKAESYDITLDANGGTPSTQTVSVTYAKNYGTLPTASWTGYTFDGWFTEKTEGEEITKDTLVTITSNQRLYAKWKPVIHNITYDLGTVQYSSLGENAPTSAQYTKTTTISAPTAKGFTFKGWTLSNTSSKLNGNTLTMGNQDIKLTANWEANLSSYVTYLYNNHSSDNNLIKDNTEDENIRYYNSNPNNYVKFNGELWRMIGVFNVSNGKTTSNRIKLIRATNLIDASWDSSNSNVNGGNGEDEWSQASIKTLLNDYYYSGTTSCLYCDDANQQTCIKTCDFSKMTNDAKNMIENAVWYLGGIEFGGDESAAGDGIHTAKEAYERERQGRDKKPFCKNYASTPHCKGDYVDRTSSWTGAVGLIYASDFGFASSNKDCYDYDVAYNTKCQKNNWMLSKEGENYWTITHRHSTYYADAIHQVGSTQMGDASANGLHGVRPSVYLKNSVKVINGNGSSSSPYILK